MLRKSIFAVVSITIFVALCAPAFATATTVINAYSADVTPAGHAIIYLYGLWGNEKHDDAHYVGVSYGIGDFLEIGGNWRITKTEDYRHKPTADAKFHWDINKKDKLTSAFAVGIDNVSTDQDKEGHNIPYVAYTQDFKDFRAHAGYSFEDDNRGIFVGLDAKTGEALLLWDWIQSNDGHDWITSFGAEVPVKVISEDFYASASLSFSSQESSSDVLEVTLEYYL
jgi:hypothetical protein